MKNIITVFLLVVSSLALAKTTITDANFSTAINNCLSTNPVDGLCNNSEYGAMPDWDVSLVTNMRDAFLTSEFNADISGWNVSNVTDMYAMFMYAESFNQDLSSWDLGNVEITWGMFYYATAFNGNIATWNVSKVSSMGFMFMGASSFNQNLNSWDVSNVTEMHQMFVNAYDFNGDISNWDVGNVVLAYSMFSNASSFNSDISNWDVSKLSSMYRMFQGASSFNQNISGWDVSDVTEMDSMFNNTALSTDNYDAILNGWSQQDVESNINLGALGVNYCNGEDARQSLMDNFGWNINDGVLDCTTASLDDENQLVASLYPNPTSDILFIKGNYNTLKAVVYDILGNEVFKVSKTHKIDISHLKKGVYFVKLSEGVKVSSHKVIKN